MTSFRITQRTIAQRTNSNMQMALGRLAKTQEQLSSGRMISRPSDNPVGTVSALRYRGDIRQAEQLVRNAQDGLEWLQSADRTLTSSLDQIRRVRDLAIQAANDSNGAASRAAIGAEIAAIRDSLLGLANTRHGGRPLFGGTTEGQAYDSDGAYTAVPGANGQVMRTIAPGETIQVNLNGPDVFGPEAPDGDNLFVLLNTMVAELAVNDASSMGSAHLDALDGHLRDITGALGTVGARYNRVETMKDRGNDKILMLKGSLSEVEDIDLPKTIMDLQLQETAYQAALSATARVLQPSLVDFLR